MRPVDLTPRDERRGGGRHRTGPLVYLVPVGLLLGVMALVALLLTNNAISDTEAEVAELQQREATARAELERVRPFAEFAVAEQVRALTVASLAESRFDWERVLEELSRITPSDVWLVNLTGSVSPDVELQDGAALAVRSEVAGPALELIGCGRSQAAVAAYVAALRDIDGVTRVTVVKSELPRGKTDADGDSEQSGDECRTRDFIARFEIVAAFDAVPPPPSSTAPPPAPVPPPGGGDSDSGALVEGADQSGGTSEEAPVVTSGAR